VNYESKRGSRAKFTVVRWPSRALCHNLHYHTNLIGDGLETLSPTKVAVLLVQEVTR
jgi:hypothetical protein